MKLQIMSNSYFRLFRSFNDHYQNGIIIYQHELHFGLPHVKGLGPHLSSEKKVGRFSKEISPLPNFTKLGQYILSTALNENLLGVICVHQFHAKIIEGNKLQMKFFRSCTMWKWSELQRESYTEARSGWSLDFDTGTGWLFFVQSTESYRSRCQFRSKEE